MSIEKTSSLSSFTHGYIYTIFYAGQSRTKHTAPVYSVAEHVPQTNSRLSPVGPPWFFRTRRTCRAHPAGDWRRWKRLLTDDVCLLLLAIFASAVEKKGSQRGGFCLWRNFIGSSFARSFRMKISPTGTRPSVREKGLSGRYTAT